MHRNLRFIAPLIAFVVGIAVFAALHGGDETSRAADRPGTPLLPAGASVDQRIAALKAAIRDAPKGKRPFAQLGDAFLQKSGESGDPAFYEDAEQAFARALQQNPRDHAAVTGSGNLALSRHDFRAALELGERARRLQPDSNAAFPVLADALIELGRYERAGQVLQQFVDRRPALPSYARISYLRELQGDLAGAVEAMRLAVSSGGSAFDVAAVQVLLGDLEFRRGRLAASRAAYRAALRSQPDSTDAEAGLARVDAATGRTDRALRRLRPLAIQPTATAELVRELGELEMAVGNRQRGRQTIARVPAAEERFARYGENIDVELSAYEADYGDPRRAVALAARGRAIHPSIRSDHALGWALTRAGRPREGWRLISRAIDHGWREPIVLYHGGMAAKAAGRPGEARRLLRRVLRQAPEFSPLHAPRARRALERLG